MVTLETATEKAIRVIDRVLANPATLERLNKKHKGELTEEQIGHVRKNAINTLAKIIYETGERARDWDSHS